MVISQIPNVYCPLKRFLNSSYFEYRLTQHCIIIFLNCREQTKEKYKKKLANGSCTLFFVVLP